MTYIELSSSILSYHVQFRYHSNTNKKPLLSLSMFLLREHLFISRQDNRFSYRYVVKIVQINIIHLFVCAFTPHTFRGLEFSHTHRNSRVFFHFHSTFSGAPRLAWPKRGNVRRSFFPSFLRTIWGVLT